MYTSANCLCQSGKPLHPLTTTHRLQSPAALLNVHQPQRRQLRYHDENSHLYFQAMLTGCFLFETVAFMVSCMLSPLGNTISRTEAHETGASSTLPSCCYCCSQVAMCSSSSPTAVREVLSRADRSAQQEACMLCMLCLHTKTLGTLAMSGAVG